MQNLLNTSKEFLGTYNIYMIPIIWGIYEFKQLVIELSLFTNQLKKINDNLSEYKSLRESLQKLILDIKSENFEDYPILAKINKLMIKTDKIINDQ